MKIKIITSITTIIAIIMVSTIQAVQAAEPDSVTVYSSRKEHLIKPLFEAFTEDTGIRVKYLTGNGGSLLERIRFEGKNTNADIYMTIDAGNLWYASSQGLFQPIESKVLKENIPNHLIDPNNLWFGLSVRARTIVYHSGRVNPLALSTYADLASPKWRKRLCLRTSKKIYTKSLVSSIIYNKGYKKAGDIIAGWVKNLAATPHAKDSHILKSISAGQCDIGIVNTYYYASHKEKYPNTDLKLFWANQDTTGVHVNISGAGITKHASNPAGAKKLLEYLSSSKAQKILTSINNEYPANQSVSPSRNVSSWGSFKQDSMNLSQAGKLQSKAVMLMQFKRYR